MTTMIDYESISNTLDQFVKAGYTHVFLTEPSALYCAPLGLRLAPDEFDISEVHHFDEDVSLAIALASPLSVFFTDKRTHVKYNAWPANR